MAIALVLMGLGVLLLVGGLALGFAADDEGAIIASVQAFQLATIGAVLLVGGAIARALESLPWAQERAKAETARQRLAADRERAIAQEARPEK